MAFRDGPTGIGGWLAFYLLTLGIISPLVTGINLYANLYADPAVGQFYGERWPAIQATTFAINFLLYAAVFYIVWRFFFRRNWKTVRLAIGVMWIAVVPAPLLEVAIVWILGGVDLATLMPAVASDLVKPIIYTTVWTAYLLRSTRVANTYPRQAPDEELATVFE